MKTTGKRNSVPINMNICDDGAAAAFQSVNT